MTSDQTAFFNYVSSFDIENPTIKMKYLHSLGVETVASEIAKRLKLSADDVKLAAEIGLLHDFGRFEQIKLFDQGTESFRNDHIHDHGDIGARELFDNDLISLFQIKPEHYPLIKTAVTNHNKYSIEARLGKRAKLHCQLIRDADKIDIFRVMAGRLPYLQFDLKAVPSAALADFNNQKLISDKNRESDLLRLLAFLYDFNFAASRDILLESGYLEQIYDHVNNKTDFKPLFDRVYKYFKTV